MTRRFIGEYARAIGKWIIYINKGIAGLEYLFVRRLVYLHQSLCRYYCAVYYFRAAPH